jgi:hypothetical protein
LLRLYHVSRQIILLCLHVSRHLGIKTTAKFNFGL